MEESPSNRTILTKIGLTGQFCFFRSRSNRTIYGIFSLINIESLFIGLNDIIQEFDLIIERLIAIKCLEILKTDRWSNAFAL